MKKLHSKIKIVGIILCAVLSIMLTSCGIKPKGIHGTELLKLADNQLYEKVYFQTLDLVESYSDEEIALSKISPEIKTVYILSVYDMEIQNGGLCAYNTGTISNSTSSATVSNSKYVGGLVGYTYGGTIEASSSTGSVSNGLTESYMGGLIGYADASVNTVLFPLSYASSLYFFRFVQNQLIGICAKISCMIFPEFVTFSALKIPAISIIWYFA